MKKTLAIMLALIMVLALVPTVAFAAGNTIYVDAKNGNDDQDGVGTTREKAYKSLDKAMKVANDGATIYLAAGTYCGNSAKPSEEGEGARKSLTFVGAGPDQTTWQIRATEKYGSDGWCDYSFKNSDNITFENMTVIGSVYLDNSIKNNDTQGLTYINHLTLKDCIFNGRADYWGYKTTTFENVTFNAPGTTDSGIAKTDYSLWTKTGRTYKFDHCTFKASGKVINVYREGTVGTAGNPIVLNFNDCEVFSSDANKSVLNIKDANNYYLVNISGINTVEGLEPNNQTCSRLFQVECYADNYNLSGGKGNSENCQAIVTIDGKTVWQDGRMVSHAIDTTYDKYTDGYKDNAFEITPVTTGGYLKTCKYCGYTEPFYGELSNEIGLKRTVKQGQEQGQEVKIETNNPKDTYKVNGPSDITVDYTATMDMGELVWQVGNEKYDKDNKYTYYNYKVSPWELLMALAQQIDGKTEVILTFKFDDKINLGTFQTNYNNAKTLAAKEKLLKLESNMFEMTDVAFGTDNTMTITCMWNWNKETDPNSTIILKGHGLPVNDNWGGNKIEITNSGCVGGMVHINPMGGAMEAMVEPGSNVAENVQVQNTYPPVDNTIKIPIVGGCKTDEFTLYYGGGSSGDSSDGSSSGGGYYHPTTTPVPVIVIPPKTGDMTVWQSILHFLGIK